MGLATRLGLMNTDITVWTEIEHPIHPSFNKLELKGQWVEESTKIQGQNNEEVTSFAYIVLSERLDLKNERVLLELGYNANIEPSASSREILGIKASPTIKELRQGITGSEWVYYV